MAEFKVIDVTAEDVAKAIEKDSARCVVAQAVARTYPKATRIEVDLQTIRFTTEGTRYAYLTPTPVQQYVIDYDAGDPIEPFSFRLHSRGRLIVSKRKKNAEGKALDAAGAQKRTRTRQAEKILADPTSTEAERTVAQERVAAAEARHDAAVAAAEGVPRSAYTPSGLSEDDKGEVVAVVHRQNVPKAKTAKGKANRHYGHRVLRENRDRFDLAPLTEGGQPAT